MYYKVKKTRINYIHYVSLKKIEKKAYFFTFLAVCSINLL